MSLVIDSVRKTFKEKFGKNPLVILSPGRINLIGEHTDYNNGFVLPAAINKAIYVAIQKRDDSLIRLYSEEYQDLVELQLSDLKPMANRWPNYILGVAAQMINRGHSLSGFDLVINGDVPLGAGLSSSAAVECATAFALNELFQFNISRLDLVKIAQKAEHEFAGVMCGIMDQFASMFGKEGYAIKLDCRSLEYQYEPLHFKGYKIVLLDSQVKHSLASSEYNTRRRECESGVSIIQTKYPQVESLRDANRAMIEECLKEGDENVYKRCVFIVDEIDRLNKACEYLEHDDLISFGKKMFETHDGLSKQYEVSCAELDFLVDQVRNHPSVIGSRMMGGGFGGCTINLVKEEAVHSVIQSVSQAYSTQLRMELKAYIVSIENGTHRVV